MPLLIIFNGDIMKTVYKNFTLHRIRLSDNLKEIAKVVEPPIDKSKMIIDVDRIDGEFDRILQLVCPYIHTGDKVLVGGHPLLCHIIITACMIKGAIPHMTKIDECKRTYYIYRVKTYFDITRKERLQLENTEIL